jgi:hypothetical protein
MHSRELGLAASVVKARDSVKSGKVASTSEQCQVPCRSGQELETYTLLHSHSHVRRRADPPNFCSLLVDGSQSI